MCAENFWFLVLTFVYSRSMGEESFCMEIFDEHVSRLQEKIKDKERKREEEKVMKFLIHHLIVSYIILCG